MNFAVMVSGNGSNLQAIIEACKKKKIRATLKLVFSNKADAYALTRARKAKVPVIAHLDPKAFKDREAYDAALLGLLKKEGIDFVVLAGYMRILSPQFIRAFKNKVLNVHPALLPAFKGSHAIQDALAYGARVTGVTVHFVDEEVDHGAIILQEAVDIKKKDTMDKLAARIHKVEHKLYPKAVRLFAEERLLVIGRTVKIK